MAVVKSPVRYQRPGLNQVDRTDHVWVMRTDGDARVSFKCVLCGAVLYGTPPAYPTPADFVCRVFEPLTDAERALCPFLAAKG